MPKVKSPSMAPLLVAIDAPIEIPAFICSEAGPVEYLKLREHHCRALLEVRGSDGLLLSCGKPKLHPEEGGGSYCPDHHRLFTNPWATRRHDGQISKIRT